MIYKVAVDISRFPEVVALQKGYNAVAGLDENANFPNLVVVVATMRTHLDTLRDAITEAEHGGDEEKTARDIARVVVDSDYRSNGVIENDIGQVEFQYVVVYKEEGNRTVILICNNLDWSVATIA